MGQISDALDKKTPLRLVQLNPEMTVAAQKDKSVSQNILKADLVLANGSGIQWAAEFLASPNQSIGNWFVSLVEMMLFPRSVQNIIPEKFTSTSFTLKVLQIANRTNRKVLLVGKPKNAHIRHTEAYLTKKFPHAEFGHFDGSNFDQQKQIELEKQLKQMKPDIVLLGLGFPAQEFAAQELKKSSSHGIFIGEGGTFDYENFGGTIRRAPKLVQSFHLEWLWRLIVEPSRWRRQLAIPRFAWSVYRSTKKQ